MVRGLEGSENLGQKWNSRHVLIQNFRMKFQLDLAKFESRYNNVEFCWIAATHNKHLAVAAKDGGDVF